jgi:hypothetical protein
MTKNHNRFILAITIATLSALSRIGYGGGMPIPHDVPVAQVLANVEAWIKAHPKEGAGLRALARTHALAWAYGEKIPLVRPGSADALPPFAQSSTVLVSRTGSTEVLWMAGGIPSDARPDRPVSPEDAKHLADSIALYRKAIEFDSNDALSELALAWMLALQGKYVRELPSDYWSDLKPTDMEKLTWTRAIAQLADADAGVRDSAGKTLSAAMPACVLTLRDVKSDDPESKARIDAILLDYFEIQALAHYRKAFDLRVAQDMNEDPTSIADGQVSARAGTQILALLSQHPDLAKAGEIKAIQDVLPPLAKKMKLLKSMPH